MIESIMPHLSKPLEPVPTDLPAGGKLSAPVKAILFDIYGTLFISESGDIGMAEEKSRIADGLQDLLTDHQIHKTPDAVLESFFETIRRTHQRLKARGVDYPEVEIDRIWSEVLGFGDIAHAKIFSVAFEALVNPVYPMPRLMDLLLYFKNKDIPMGIISNAQFFTPLLFNWYLGRGLEELGFSKDLLIFSYQHGRAKPSMKLFDMAANKLADQHIAPDNVLYMGNDMLNDIYPANQIGFQTALFAGDARSLRLRKDDPRCTVICADLVITNLTQLIDYIK